MKRSLNEISGMVHKAARGAGLPLGHAEDLAKVAGYLAATDPVAMTCLVDVLAGPFDPPYFELDSELRIGAANAAMVAPLVVDALRSGIAAIVISEVKLPAIIFASCALNGLAVAHRFEGDQLALTACAPESAVPPAKATTVSQEIWSKLDAYACRTYVPASEASRVGGAGAGLNDND